MSEISHRIARDYTQKEADGLLNEKHNAALNIHIEACPECRAYITELRSLEINLRKVMHKRWDIYGYRSHTSRLIQTHLARQKSQKNMLGFAGMLILGGLLLIALVNTINWFLPQQEVGAPVIAPPMTVSSTSPSFTPTVVETPRAEHFAGELPSDWLALTAYQGSGDCDIYLVKADGSEFIDISNNTACDWGAVWSPDGQKLAFVSDRDGSSQIFALEVDSMEISQLTESSQLTSVHFCSETVDVGLQQKEGYFGISWSPDGELLVATMAMNLDGNMFEPLFLIAADGSGVSQFTEGNDIYPQWSPDGEKVGFIRLADCNGSGHDVIVINRDGSGLTHLTVGPASESNAFAWSPDSRQIAFFSTTDINDDQHETNIELVNADGTNRIALLELGDGTSRNGGEITWSPDGNRLAYINPHQGDDGQIHLLDIESRETIFTSAISDHYFGLSWSPDSKWLLFAAGLDQPVLYILEVNSALETSGDPLPLQTGSLTGYLADPKWQPSP